MHTLQATPVVFAVPKKALWLMTALDLRRGAFVDGGHQLRARPGRLRRYRRSAHRRANPIGDVGPWRQGPHRVYRFRCGAGEPRGPAQLWPGAVLPGLGDLRGRWPGHRRRHHGRSAADGVRRSARNPTRGRSRWKPKPIFRGDWTISGRSAGGTSTSRVPFLFCFFLGFMANQGMKGMIGGAIVGALLSRMVSKIRADKHPAFAWHWTYWHLPEFFTRMKATPPSHVRRMVG